MKSVFLKKFLLSAAVLLLSFLIFAFAFSSVSYDIILSDRMDTIAATASVVADSASVKSMDASIADWDFRLTITTISLASGAHIAICDKDGLVCSCSDKDIFCRHIGITLDPQSFMEKTPSGCCELTDLSGFYETERYVSAAPIYSPYSEEIIGYVLASADTVSISSAWSGFIYLFVIIAAAILAAALIISWLMAKHEVEPLREMADAVRAFGRGNMSLRVREEKRCDEIGELEKAFNQMAASLETAEAQRREFIANVSHELKTPMTTIAGYSDGLLDGTIPWENRERYLMLISDETRRLARLVRKMLNVSSLDSKPIQANFNARCDLCETLRVSLLSLEGLIEAKNLAIDAQIPDGKMTVCGEGDDIRQVCYNILENAVKFSLEGGVISVKLWKEGSRAFVQIENNGAEIPKEELPYIFDRFHKSDKSRSIDRDGVGLGLFIVKSIINAYRETINVTSENGKTVFTFTMTVA